MIAHQMAPVHESPVTMRGFLVRASPCADADTNNSGCPFYRQSKLQAQLSETRRRLRRLGCMHRIVSGEFRLIRGGEYLRQKNLLFRPA